MVVWGRGGVWMKGAERARSAGRRVDGPEPEQEALAASTGVGAAGVEGGSGCGGGEGSAAERREARGGQMTSWCSRSGWASGGRGVCGMKRWARTTLLKDEVVHALH